MEIAIRIIGALQLILSIILIPIFYLLSFRKLKFTPPIKSDLLRLSATQIAKKIRNKELTSLEVVEAYIARIQEVNPLLNAVVEERFDDARKDAIKADRLVQEKDAKTLEKEMPLLGVPVTIKESCRVKGLSISGACLPRKNLKAEEDGVTVALIKNAGGIPLCATNTPELCLCWESGNKVTGRTLNPYNIYRTSGGSSGGEGALLGSGSSVVGIGSDIAGSIRVPAMFNGIYGHKPSPDLVSLDGHFPNSKDPLFSKFLTIGPMARYVEDLPLMMKVMAGENASKLNLDQEVSLKNMNVLYMKDCGFSLVMTPVQSEITQRMEEAAKYLKTNYGCNVQKGHFEELSDSMEIAMTAILEVKDVPNLLDLSNKKSKDEMNLFTELFKSFVGVSEFTHQGMLFMLLIWLGRVYPKSLLNKYKTLYDTLRQKFLDSLKDNGVFLFPTFPVPALHHGEIFAKTSGVMYTMIFNALGLPSTHVPLGLDRDGLPIGIQVVAAPYQDRLCFAVAKAIDEKFGGWIPPPSA